jgi:hypothetical protein
MSNEQEKDKSEDLPKEDGKDGSQKPDPKEPSKKKWELAPRTGQRHANPFQRKTK